MPEAVPVVYADFRIIREELESLGFRRIPPWVKQKIVRYRDGVAVEEFVIAKEVGFEFFHHGYQVRAWTSCLHGAVYACDWAPSSSFDVVVGRPAGEDAGWIVIVDPIGREQYFARKVMRTKNFVRNFLERVRITQKKVIGHPVCLQCGRRMEIVRRRKTTGATFWACYNKDAHIGNRPVWEDWDVALSEKDLKIAEGWRRSRRRSRESARTATLAGVSAENSTASL